MYSSKQPHRSKNVYQYAGFLNSPGPQVFSMHQFRRLYQSTRHAFPRGTCSGPHMSPYFTTRSAGFVNAPGLQPASMHQSGHPCRRYYQVCSPHQCANQGTRVAGIINPPGLGLINAQINAPVLQALSIHQARSPERDVFRA